MQRNLIFWRRHRDNLRQNFGSFQQEIGDRFHPRFFKFDTCLRTKQEKHEDNEKNQHVAAIFPQQSHVFTGYDNLHVNNRTQQDKKNTNYLHSCVRLKPGLLSVFCPGGSEGRGSRRQREHSEQAETGCCCSARAAGGERV